MKKSVKGVPGIFGYAVKDGSTTVRKCVCRADEEQGVAIKTFRKIVDETEAG